MDYVKMFEEPLPVINGDENEIQMEAVSYCKGHFVVKNKGQGQIKGSVVSDSSKISFNPSYFSGNDSVIEFDVDITNLKPGDVFKSKFIIISNGGQHIINLHVKIILQRLETKEGAAISSLIDFYHYSQTYPKSSAELFISNAFKEWLSAIHYPFMAIYEKFSQDSNIERGLDNFFVYNSFKKKAETAVLNREITLFFKPNNRELHRGTIAVKVINGGYIEEFITSVNTSPWLRIEKEKIVADDFDENRNYMLHYTVNPLFLDKRVNHGKIFIGDHIILIKIFKEKLLKVRTEKQYFGFQDQGKLIFNNYTGGKIPIDIRPKDQCIKFEGIRFIIGSYAEIPFEISVSPIQAAQMNLLRQPIINTNIEIESILKTGGFKKKFSVTIGNLQ